MIQKALTLFSALFIISMAHPDAALTPGQIRPESKTGEFCHGKSTKTVRDVTVATKKKIFQSYHLKYSDHRNYEVDHFIPLCAGGANSVKNLWPQPLDEAHLKDKDEDFVCKQICAGKMTNQQAQDYIRKKWAK